MGKSNLAPGIQFGSKPEFLLDVKEIPIPAFASARYFRDLTPGSIVGLMWIWRSELERTTP
jgi:hypothetical protein